MSNFKEITNILNNYIHGDVAGRVGHKKHGELGPPVAKYASVEPFLCIPGRCEGLGRGEPPVFGLCSQEVCFSLSRLGLPLLQLSCPGLGPAGQAIVIVQAGLEGYAGQAGPVRGTTPWTWGWGKAGLLGPGVCRISTNPSGI